MKLIRIDKAASSTVNVSLDEEVSASGDLEPVRGKVCVVRALEEKRVYDRIELVTGRMAKVSRGDIIAGVLGERRALQGFAGVIPDHMRAGDVLNILNIGGVIGKAISYNLQYGQPFRVELLGTVERDGKTLNIGDGALPTAENLEGVRDTALIVVSGTSMNSGKTEVAAKLTQELTWKGYRVCSVKVSGISALKDMLNMEDHGAVKALSFLDFGYPSTVYCGDVARITKGAIRELSRYEPDVILVELGDGILGDYGVFEFYRDGEIKAKITCNIVCALDPVGAWGISKIMEEGGISVHLISGPVTDNVVGTDFLKSLHFTGLNAFYQKKELGDFIEGMINKG
ncbi:hypothetical protein AMJ74_00485 [candidate division WOR_3 bacterium SM1_77]|uniref:DUF1611 domain-containing protein n=1 Tax=candidate division WOR_3 bacterium SM1_77 TaxID=1703778 RepID=A0A0S8K1G6_UNCW3|nr:MAG: hypothetical protein AMJ74_00485 [candidate division WOR_3 bacterium SM1_77]